MASKTKRNPFHDHLAVLEQVASLNDDVPVDEETARQTFFASAALLRIVDRAVARVCDELQKTFPTDRPEEEFWESPVAPYTVAMQMFFKGYLGDLNNGPAGIAEWLESAAQTTQESVEEDWRHRVEEWESREWAPSIEEHLQEWERYEPDNREAILAARARLRDLGVNVEAPAEA